MKLKTSTITNILIVIAIVIVVNLIGYRMFNRLDLSENKIYSLSDASKDIVSSLEDPLTIKVYFTKNLPAPYSNIERYVRDKMEDYKAYSNSNFNFEFVDPGNEEDLKKEAMSYQIPPLQLQVLENDEFSVKQAFMGMVFLYQDKKETIPVLGQVKNLEYQMTRIIQKLTSVQKKKVALLKNYNSEEMTYQSLTETLNGEDYEVIEVNTDDGLHVLDDVDIVAIINPTKDIDDKTKYILDQFILKNGKILFAMNGVKASLNNQNQQPEKVTSNWFGWIENYGAKINNDLVYDKDSAMITVRQQSGMFVFNNQIAFPYFPKITQFNKANPISSNLEALINFFPSSIDSIKKENAHLTPLYFSSDKSGKQADRFYIDAVNAAKTLQYPEKNILLGGTITGQFNSLFDEKSIPFEDGKNSHLSSGNARFVVLGDGNIFNDNYIKSSGDANLTFILNTFDWLTQNSALISIRSKEVTERPLVEVSKSTKTFAKSLNFFLAPILIIIFGVIRWQIRKKMKRGWII